LGSANVVTVAHNKSTSAAVPIVCRILLPLFKCSV
jgi:hypothetical protein